MRVLSLSSIILFTLVSLPRAQAAGGNGVKAKAAKKACAAGDFRKGVELLADLYVDTNQPTHIYNQARCYEQNHQWESAIDRFREYLRKAERLTTRDRADAEKHIADCEAFFEKEQPKVALAPLAPPPPAALPPPPPPPLAAPPPPVKTTTAVEPVPQAGSPGAGLRATGIVLAVVGVATLATGGILNYKANSLADDFNRTGNPASRSSQSSYKTGSFVCYGAGAGSLLVGSILYLVGRRSHDATPAPVALMPILAPEQLALTIQGTF
jgi:hypothetical protein